jgi:beta-galactosidase
VSWDDDSIMVRGERLLLLPGEVHLFRIPSFRVSGSICFRKSRLSVTTLFPSPQIGDSWKGTPGEVVVEGVFALDEFFSAASEAGIYVIARLGPVHQCENC